MYEKGVECLRCTRNCTSKPLTLQVQGDMLLQKIRKRWGNGMKDKVINWKINMLLKNNKHMYNHTPSHLKLKYDKQMKQHTQ